MSGPEKAKGEVPQTTSIDIEQIVDTGEIVKRLGLARIPVIHNWIARYPDFPTPIVILRPDSASTLRLWDFRDVKRWYDRRQAK